MRLLILDKIRALRTGGRISIASGGWDEIASTVKCYFIVTWVIFQQQKLNTKHHTLLTLRCASTFKPIRLLDNHINQ